MSDILWCLLLTILGVEFIIGIFGNLFMAVVNIMYWVKRRKISLMDLILTALAISRIVFVGSLFTAFLIFIMYPALMMNEEMMNILNISWTMINHFSIWLATCLSIFYFLKIANLSNSLFLYLKWRVKNVVSGTLLLSLPILCINIIVINMNIAVWIDECKTNMSFNSVSNDYVQFFKISLLTNTIFTLIPFTVSLITFLLLIFSLWKHLRNMQHSAQDSQDVSTTAHIKALHTVVTFLLLYTIFFLSLALQSWKNEVLYKNLIHLCYEAAGLIFPSGHSCVLILGNTRLRQTFLSAMCWLRCRLKMLNS
uniref:Taste receptor type 2 n=1 Tax=Nannospalax galili TaxID=1026970 RepID=A0A7S5W8A8_NANGA|nr:taste receptor type 2 member 580 [Nannospalax galili]